MAKGAPRLSWRALRCCIRGALLALCLWPTPEAADAQQIVTARFTAPTQHYPHGILGDAVEYSGLTVALSTGRSYTLHHPENGRVFEDITPRLWDITGDGSPEIVVIETDPPQGAQLAVYGLSDGKLRKLTATPHIGQTNRWLAPIGAADLDGDGHIELAYIDRPHLAKTLRIWRYKAGRLHEVADAPGLTNHKIGWNFIAGGLRHCQGTPELITANADWTRIFSSRFDGQTIHSRDIGPYLGPHSLNTATRCP